MIIIRLTAKEEKKNVLAISKEVCAVNQRAARILHFRFVAFQLSCYLVLNSKQNLTIFSIFFDSKRFFLFFERTRISMSVLNKIDLVHYLIFLVPLFIFSHNFLLYAYYITTRS